MELIRRWKPLLFSPTWYVTIVPEIQGLAEQLKNSTPERRRHCRSVIYDFFEQHIIKGDIALGGELPHADADRRPIDTVVIHHTSNPPGLSESRLSAIELVRLYAPYFANPKAEADKHLKGQPITSGHLRSGKPVFWPYHWIVRSDGRAERLLFDTEIGWHAGNWDVNCRSVAIALDNDYEWQRPTAVEIQGIAAVISRHYRGVPLTRIVGHREVSVRTTCPSNLFQDGPHGRGWKSVLLEVVRADEITSRTAA